MARVESKTLICTKNKYDTIPHHMDGIESAVGKWADPIEMKDTLHNLFKGCMKGTLTII